MQCLLSIGKDWQLIRTYHAVQQARWYKCDKGIKKAKERNFQITKPSLEEVTSSCLEGQMGIGQASKMGWRNGGLWTEAATQKTMIQPRNSRGGWNSGIWEEIKLQKKVGARLRWAWHAKLKKFNFLPDIMGNGWKFLKWDDGVAMIKFTF